MGTTKRQRQKEGRTARLEAARLAQQRAQRRNRIISLVAGVAVVALLAFVFSALIGNNDKSGVTTNGGSSSTTTSGGTATSGGTGTSAAPADTVVPSAPAPGATLTGDTPCPKSDGSSPRTTTFAKAPPMCTDPAKTYQAKVSTDKGDFTILLRSDEAPQTVNNFVVLSLYHYYDGVAFHRVIPGFVVQGGDATGEPPGTGGPGYTIPDEFPTGSGSAYTVADVAMANTGQPDTGGSQFFVVTGDQGAQLPPQYSLFGMVTEGFDAVKAIEKVGTDAGGVTEAVTIKSVTITVSDQPLPTTTATSGG